VIDAVGAAGWLRTMVAAAIACGPAATFTAWRRVAA
jgi:hypothetical protein